MEMNNNLLDIEIWNPIDSSQLLYKRNAEISNSVSKMTNNLSPKKGQHIQNEALAFKTIPKPQGKGISNNNSNMSSLQNTFNIQLLYNINQVTEQDA